MDLKEIISDTHKEISGSRTKNRLTVQISYAVQLIMELYSTDYLVLMDYIEDISVINNPENPSNIHLYQVKTKSSDKAYLLSAIINDKWFQKLYENAQKYNPFLGSASVVCNTDVVHSGVEVFHNEKSLLKDFEIDNNILKIKKAIAKDLDLKEAEIDLSQFYFIRSNLSVKGHKNEVEHEFEEFLLKKDSELQVATVKSIYKLIYDKLDENFNNEIIESVIHIRTTLEKSELNANRQWVRIFCFYQRYQFLSCNKKAGGTSVSPATVLLILQHSVPEVPAVLPRLQNIPALSEVSTVQFFQSHNREFPCR